jgi:hypothetical protein
MIVSIATYRRVVRDFVSFDGDVQDKLVDAQQLFEDITWRQLEREERTEQLAIYFDTNGDLSFPRATPVVSVSEPSGATVDSELAVRLGFTCYRGSWVTVTYVGGYETEADVPTDFVRTICFIARDLFSTLSVPAGARRVQVADVSYEGSLTGAGEVSQGLVRKLHQLRRRSV